MYTLIRRAGVRHWLLVEAPSLSVSIVVAELFYKFHSFTLECLAFLATWFVVGFAARLVTVAFSRIGAIHAPGTGSPGPHPRNSA